MTGEHLEAILKNAQAEAERDGYIVVPEGPHDPLRRA